MEDSSLSHKRPVIRPLADIIENDLAITLSADMPGVNETSLDIQIEGQVLTIHGKNSFKPPSKTKLSWTEFCPADYECNYTLGEKIDVERIEAKVNNGILELKLPKIQAPKPRKIQVKVG